MKRNTNTTHKQPTTVARRSPRAKLVEQHAQELIEATVQLRLFQARCEAHKKLLRKFLRADEVVSAGGFAVSKKFLQAYVVPEHEVKAHWRINVSAAA